MKHTLSSYSQNFSPIFGSIRCLHVWSLSELLQAKWSCFLPIIISCCRRSSVKSVTIPPPAFHITKIYWHLLSAVVSFPVLLSFLFIYCYFSRHLGENGGKNSVQPAMFNWKLALFILFHYFYFPVLIHFQIPLKIILVIMLTFQWLICFVSQCK